MRLPNWKRRGYVKNYPQIRELPKQRLRQQVLEAKIAAMPPELQEFARKHPHLAQ